jgi:hypothetical protein
MQRRITFDSNGLALSGHLYIPNDHQSGEKRPAIAVSHPFGGVKEQTAGLYAKQLSERGFVTLAFDASFQGESEGSPRHLEDPFARVEDVKGAVTHLSTCSEVDPARIGALGICASGGYVPFAATTDRRIKAVATVSAVDMGQLFREGLGGSTKIEALHTMLEEAGQSRTEVALGKSLRLEHIVPHVPEEIPDDSPALYREGTDYYRTPRGQHANSQNLYVFYAVDRIASYASYDRIEMISPRPLLMIAGDKADTLYFSKQAIKAAKDPKELFQIKGATHVDLYDKEEYVGPAVEKMAAFFEKGLG